MPIFSSGFAAGGATAPGDGGATPIIVIFASGFFGTGAGAGTGFAAIAAGPVPPGEGSRCATAGGAFIMSIVPLNLGASAPLMLKPHFWHFALFSSFCVPQFGQNTQLPPLDRIDMLRGGAFGAYIERPCCSS